MMQRYWLSTPRMTVGITIDANRHIVKAAPIVTRFIGQPFENLTRWMQRQGYLWMENITPQP